MIARFLASIFDRKGWLLICLIIAVGIAGILAGIMWGTTETELGAWNKAADFAGDLGKAALGGGVSGAVIKIMATEGFFLDAVAAVAYGNEGLERRTADERIELWRTLTRKIYLPFLGAAKGGAGASPANQELAGELEAAIARSFGYNKLFYIKQLRRRIEVRWEDDSRQRIEVEDIQDVELAPFDPTEAIEWSTESRPDSGASMQDYSIEQLEFKIYPEPKRKPEVLDQPHVRKATYFLEGGNKHEIHRRRLLRWRLDKDPIMAFVSPYVVRELRLELVNRAEDLRITFKDLGMNSNNLFVPVGELSKQVEFGQQTSLRATSVILPDQGFLIVFVRTN